VYVAASGAIALGDATRAVSAANGAIGIVATGAVTMGQAVTTTDLGATARVISIAGASVAVSQNIQAANNGQISITSAAGAITRSAGVVGSPGSTSTLVLSSAASIGADGAPLNVAKASWLFTDVGTIRAAAAAGGIFISQANGVQLGDGTAGLSATGGNVDVSAGGPITTGSSFPVSASGATSDLYLSGTALAISGTISAGRVVNLTGSVAGISIAAATGIVNGGTGLMTFNNVVTHSAGQINLGSGGAQFVGDYVGSGTASLAGNATGVLNFAGNATFGGFTANTGTIVMNGSAATQQFDSNGNVICNFTVDNTGAGRGVQLVNHGVGQTGGSFVLTLTAGYLDLNGQGWIATSGATAPTAGQFNGVNGSLSLASLTELRCAILNTTAGTYSISNPAAGPNSLITASGSIDIEGPFSNPAFATLVMTGTPTTLKTGAAVVLGTLKIGIGTTGIASGPTATVALASALQLASDLQINDEGALDVTTFDITIAGNWTNRVEAAGASARFNAEARTVTFTKPVGVPISIVGSNDWWNFACTVAGQTIQFDNHPAVQTFINGITVTGTSTNKISLTRLNPAGGNPTDPTDPTQAHLFWDIDVRPTVTVGLLLNWVDVFYSNANLNPIIATTTVSVSPFSSHWCYKWLSGLILVYSYAEDSDGNGKIDRIRVQAATSIGNDFSGFSVNVAGYTVTGYSRPVPGNNFYIRLEEQSYNDSGATPAWTITSNTSLKDDSTGTKLAISFTDPSPMTPVDTAIPRIAYTLALPNSGHVFVHMSEPVYATGPAISFLGGGGYTVSGPPAAVTTVSGGGISEFMLSGSALTAQAIAGGADTITLANAKDAGIPPVDAFLGNSSLPHPTYPTALGNYSAYDVPPAHGGVGIPPPYTPNAAAATHRVSDVLVDVPMAAVGDPGYFIWPIYAKDSVKLSLSDSAIAALTPAQTASQGIGLIRAFDGSEWLRAQTITLQARMQSALPGISGATLWFDSNVPAALTSAYGLWLPKFAQTGFSGLVPFPNAPSWGRGASASIGSSPGSGLYNFTIPASDPRVVSISKLDFFFTLQSDPAGEPLYVLRLDLPAGAAPGAVPADSAAWHWYLNLKPFSFQLHNVTLQKGGTTILNNVIDPTKGQTARLSYQLASAGSVTVTVFTLDGDVVMRLVNGQQAAGDYSVDWNGRNMSGAAVARGLYFVRIVAPGIDEIRKVLVVRNQN
jgi:hypothetical protein